MNEMMVFNFDSKQVRTRSSDDSEVWFSLTDVCSALDINNVSDADKRIDDMYKDDFDTIDGIGRRATMRFVNEFGLYELIFTSRKEEAKKFKKWVVTEVLPSIRKTGSYSFNQPIDKAQVTFNALKKVSEDFGLVGNQALLSANKATKMITGYDFQSILQIELKNVKQERWLTPTQLGKHFNLSPQKINKLLESKGFQSKTNNMWTATIFGKPYSTLLDANKKHSDGTPINQLKWCESIISQLS